jgi:hypothetical protein
MNRIIVWLGATVILMILLTGYQLRVAGAGGGEEQRAPVGTVESGSSGAPAPEESHPPK